MFDFLRKKPFNPTQLDDGIHVCHCRGGRAQVGYILDFFLDNVSSYLKYVQKPKTHVICFVFFWRMSGNGKPSWQKSGRGIALEKKDYDIVSDNNNESNQINQNGDLDNSETESKTNIANDEKTKLSPKQSSNKHT